MSKLEGKALSGGLWWLIGKLRSIGIPTYLGGLLSEVALHRLAHRDHVAERRTWDAVGKILAASKTDTAAELVPDLVLQVCELC